MDEREEKKILARFVESPEGRMVRERIVGMIDQCLEKMAQAQGDDLIFAGGGVRFGRQLLKELHYQTSLAKMMDLQDEIQAERVHEAQRAQFESIHRPQVPRPRFDAPT